MQDNEDMNNKTIDITNGDISDIDNLNEAVFADDNPGSSEHTVMDLSLMPEIKGIELLKKAGSTLNVGKTIKSMFSIIHSMENQLKKVLSINTTLEKDLKASREVISDLKEERTKLNITISDLEEELPLKRELQAGIDHLIEERNSAQPLLRDVNLEVKKIKREIDEVKERANELEVEKSDLLKEIGFLEIRLGSANQNISAHEKEIMTLKGERMIHMRKIKALEEKNMKQSTEKKRLANEVRDSKMAVDEIQSRFTESEIESKRSFYETDEV